MQIILRGPAAGYEAEHTARLFFPDAEKSENLPQDSDFVLAQNHLCTDTILLRLHGRLSWKIACARRAQTPSTRSAAFCTRCWGRPPAARRPGA
jgi:hypothetical protein